MNTLPSYTADPEVTAVFDALGGLMRNLVRLAGNPSHSRQIVAKLDDCLVEGWMLKAEFSIGGAGALGLSLIAVSPLGMNTEVVCIDAPPSAAPFRLAESALLC